MQNQRGFVSAAVLIAIILGLIVVGGGVYYVVQQQAPTQTASENFDTVQTLPTNNNGTQHTQATSNTSAPTNTQTQTTAQPSLQTFKSENGFQFQYPSAWKATGSEQAGTSYQLLARVVNPARAGKPDTDVPIEQFLVRRMDVACQGSATTFAGKTAYDTGWTAGGMDAGMSYRSVCVQVSGWPIHIDGSAADQASKTIMDKIFSSLTFTSSQSAPTLIPDIIRVTSPNGGEVFNIGDHVQIKWSWSSGPGDFDVNVSLIRSDGSVIVRSIAYNQARIGQSRDEQWIVGKDAWNIATPEVVPGKYKIRVSASQQCYNCRGPVYGNVATDDGDGWFTIR